MGTNVKVLLNGRLRLNPPPRDAVLELLMDVLDRWPNGLVEGVAEVDGHWLFYIIGPIEQGATRVHVWERDEAEALAKANGRAFPRAPPPRRAAP